MTTKSSGNKIPSLGEANNGKNQLQMVDWKQIVDMLLFFVQHPKRTKSHLRQTLNVIALNLDEKPSVYCPVASEMVQNTEVVLQSYKDFLCAITNCFLIMLSKDLEYSKVPGIASFYQKLMQKLFHNCGSLFVYLMGKFMSSLKNILDVYVNHVEFYPPISIGTFVSSRITKWIPEECRTLVRFNGLNSANSAVSFLTNVIFNSHELLLESPLSKNIHSLVLRRLEAWDLFSYSDLTSQDFLLSFPFGKYPECLPQLTDISTLILTEAASEKQAESFTKLKDHIAKLFLNEEFPLENLKSLLFPVKLKTLVMKQCEGPKEKESSSSVLLTKLLRLDYLDLTEVDIKWLAHKFAGESKTAGKLLLAFLETELRRSIPVVQTLTSTQPHAIQSKGAPRRSLNQSWQNAEDYSKVWQILQSLFTKTLNKLALMEDENQSHSLLGIRQLHLVLDALQIIVCRLDQEQRNTTGISTSIVFCFFPLSFKKVIAQMGVLPNHCIESMPVKSKSATKERCQSSIQSWQHVLDMLNISRRLPEASKLEPEDLNAIEVLCGIPWLTRSDQVPLPESKLEWYQHMAEVFHRNLKDVPDTFSNDIMKCFCVELNKTRTRPSAWRIKTIKTCLMTLTGEHLDIMLKSLPLVITTCQRSDIPIIYSAFLKVHPKTNPVIVQTVAEILPSIVCALSGSCEIQDLINDSQDHTMVDVKMSCSECNKNSYLSGPKGWNFLNLLGNFSQEWQFLISNANSTVKKYTISGLPQVLKHLGATFKIADYKIWLNLLSDSDPSVSAEFASHVPSFLGLISNSETKEAVFSYLFDKLDTLIVNTWSSKTSWNSVFLAMNGVLKIQDEFIVQPVMRLIIKLIALKKEDICGVNQTVVDEYFRYNHISPMVLFFQFEDENWGTILDVMSTLEPHERNTIYCFRRICNIFNFPSDILKKHLFRFLQVLIPKCLEDNNFLHNLSDTAQYLGVNQQTMLQKWHCHLYPVFFVNHPECLDFYLKLANSDDDLDRQFTLVIVQVILKFHANKIEIFSKLSSILKDADDKPDLAPDEFSEHMQVHLHGILNIIQINVLNKYACNELKLKSLLGFSNFLELMNKEAVSPSQGKILDALCTFKNLEEPDLVKAYCALVLSFLKSLENDKVATVMFTVMTNVTFLDKAKYRKEAKAILDFFLITKKRYLSSHGLDLLNLIPLLEEFNYTSILETCKKRSESLSVEEMLEVKLNAISSNYVESQIMALKELKVYLSSVQQSIQQILFSHSRECICLNQIIGKLITGSSSTNSTVRLLSIECLSQLGAIDPGHWIISHGFNEKPTFFFDSACAEFVVRALETLLDGFQASTKKADMDIIGFVCQEFMKASDFQDEPAKAPVQIWNQFSEQTKTMLLPFFTSNYFAIIPVELDEFPHPIFGSRLGRTCEDWIFHWVVRLIGMIKCKSIRDTFDALKLVFKINLKNTLFFLPHIFIHAIWAASPDDLDMIVEEMTLAAKLNNNPIKMSEEESLEIVFQALGLNFDMQSFVDAHSRDSNTAKNETALRCAKVIFFLVDYLMHWNLEYELGHHNSGSAKSRSSKESSCSDSSRETKSSVLAYKYRQNKEFLERFSLDTAAEQSHSCNENFRALRYLDMHCLKKKETTEECLSLFLQVHSQLQNSDFVHGISSIKKGATAKGEHLLLYEMNGQSQESIIWYEKMLANGEGETREIICNMVKAHLHLEQYQPVLGIVQKYTSHTENTKFCNALAATKLEAQWRMGAWESLQNTLQSLTDVDKTWAYYFSKVLVSIFNCDHVETSRNILEMRKALGDWLSKCGANSSSYANNYSTFLMMHVLGDVEIITNVLHPSSNMDSLSTNDKVNKIKTAIEAIESRQKRVRFAWKGLQMVLSVRRTMLSLLQQVLAGFGEIDSLIKKQLGLLWLESARIAISQHQFSQALGYTISGEQCGLKETFLLQAQLEWESGHKDLALIYLHRGVDKYFSDWPTYKQLKLNFRVEDRKICAKAKLLIAEYSTKMKIVDNKKAVYLYKDAISCYPQWEETNVHMARSWDKLKQNKGIIFNEAKHINVLNEIVKSYTLALSFGVKHLYESLPRIITIWANTGGKLLEVLNKTDKVSLAKKELYLNSFNSFNENLKNLVANRLPHYAFYACFNSLSSRICHPYKPVYTMIQDIFVSLLKVYPYQMLWKLVPMLKVSHSVRVNRIQEVLLKFGRENPDKNKLMDDYLKLCSFLFDLGHKNPGKAATSRAKMSNLLPALLDFFQDPNISRILMPTDDLMSVVLPADDLIDYKNHNAFPRDPVYITRVMEPVSIIASLQKPKKFSFLGSDDNEYAWLVKNKDDLRIDAAVMHFMQVLNNLLDQDPECKERRLTCRTYSVVPLGEDCGLIEFVPNLVTLRQVIMGLYKGKGVKNETREELRKNDAVEQKRKVFEGALIPAHPPVLSDWFHWKFSDHSAWNEARKRFIMSTAVMSVVGYILGLGDRHGGNITLNEKTGESIHVDYNCIFNKGETLPWPEKVPFRLTHNMITAMGVAGIEGPYKKAAELTLRVMRRNSETLLSVLKPIMFDATAKNAVDDKVEFLNKGVIQSLNRVQMRLSGFLNDSSSGELSAELSLSPEGHANAIIRQATDVNNLCQMYPGWGAFL